MSEEKQHHHLFNHKKEENTPSAVVYSETTYGDEEVIQSTDVYGVGNVKSDEYEKALKEEKHHKQKEHFGEMGAVAAGAFALHEKHAEKKDPENAHRHKIEEEIAAAAAVGEGGYVFHEHHEKKESKEEAEEAQGKKHHHLF